MFNLIPSLMKKTLFSIALILILSGFAAPQKKESLFNGKDLTGWKIYGTEKFYKNFDITVEFLQESNGNSGLFFRSTIEGTKIAGWQCEVAPQGKDTGGIYESYGRGWLKQIPDEKENILKPGEWNKMRLRVEGDRVQSWLNGETMVDFTDEKIGKANGSIALQIHDGGGIKVRWRNLIIEELP
jgi:hypothetical protein